MKAYWHKIKKILTVIIASIIILQSNTNLVMASDIVDEVDENYVKANENQYLELRAVEVKEVTGQNKQVIMELWGHDIDFKRI